MSHLELAEEEKKPEGTSQSGTRDQVVTDEVLRLRQDLATQQQKNKQLGSRMESLATQLHQQQELTTQLHQKQEELTTQLQTQHEELTAHFQQQLTDQLTIQEMQQKLQALSQQVQSLQPSWIIAQYHLQITPQVLGRGAWGEVRVGIYQGTRVAVKKMHDVIISNHNREQFEREMVIASKVRIQISFSSLEQLPLETSPLSVN